MTKQIESQNTDFTQDNLIWDSKSLPNRLTEDEDIVLIVREDLIILGLKFSGFIFLFILMLVGKLFLSGINNPTIAVFYDAVMYTAISGFILSFAYVFHNYYLSLQIVTSKRLIDIDQRGIFNREVNELPIEKIEDVTYKQKSFFATIFNYGTVSVQTAADSLPPESPGAIGHGGFIFENVPSPAKIQSIINNIFHKNTEDQIQKAAEMNAKYMRQEFQRFPGQNNLSNQNFQPNTKVPSSLNKFLHKNPIPQQNFHQIDQNLQPDLYHVPMENDFKNEADKY